MHTAFASSLTLQWKRTPHLTRFPRKTGALPMKLSTRRRCYPLTSNSKFRTRPQMTAEAPDSHNALLAFFEKFNVRKFVIGGAYAVFLALVALGPGDWREPGVLADIFTLNFDSVNSIYLGVLGLSFVQSVSYVQLLQPGFAHQARSMSSALLTFTAALVGFPVLGPYLFLRKYVPRIAAPKKSGSLAPVITASLCAAGALVCYGVALSVLSPGTEVRDVLVYAAAVDFVRAMKHDFWFRATAANSIALALCVIDPLAEDMQRRGWSFRGGDALEAFVTLATIFAVPGFGVASFIVTRPDVRSMNGN